MSAQPTLHAVEDSSPALDPALLQHLLGYIGVVRDALRMQGWDIVLFTEPTELEDTWAETWQSYNHQTTNIKIGRTLLQQKPTRIRNTLVHELVHAQHRDVSILWEGCTVNNSEIPERDSRSWNSDFTMHMERLVSWVTQRIEDSVPLYDADEDYPAPVGCFLHGEEPS